ncbi:Ig-like domain-containing protein [Pyxidicoccus parkwayensis]|uniref:Ig-like domain-containing protein n=1 Tax=Pyxidicoccus parkwayensis TaxID=2813578 RepID=A0ABX7NWS5_9BACT|nr:Ig-like domain-containing protein [Pyxidicoccus parkwaysis]QSQ21826.1 Ig-like domain-containing protein [Pyxidicoccus parkwaysis]
MAVVLLSSPACISVPDIEPAKAEVRITSPEGTAYTNGVLEVRLEVTGHTPERVELLKDGEVLAEVAAPYVYAWDTTGVAEGTHQLVARAVFGDVTFPSEVREVVVDRTAPTVVSRTPEPGAQDVWVKSPIQAVFSEPVKAGTLTSESVRLTVGGVEVARTVTVAADGRTVTVVPGAGYEPSNSVTLEFLPQATDLAGNGVGVVEPWTWLVPYWIPWGNADNAIVGTASEHIEQYTYDNSGNLTALWKVMNGSGFSIYARKFESGDWKTLGQSLATAKDDWDIPSREIALDGNGNPVVAWTKRITSGTVKKSIKKWVDNQWVSIGDGLNSPDGFPLEPFLSLQMSPRGNPAIAWCATDTGGTTAKLCTSEWQSSNWIPFGSCIDIQFNPVYYTSPILRFSPQGNPTVAWFAEQGGYNKIFAGQYINGTWTRLAGDPDDHGTDLQIAGISMTFNNSGLPAIAWNTSLGDGNYALATEHWSGEGWLSLGTFFPTRAISPWASHSLQADSSGTPFLAWVDGRLHVQRWTGTSWQFLEDASNSEVSYISSEALQLTQSGVLVLAWFHSDGDESRIRMRRFNH